ncbi:hypothetical protein ABIB85_008187 [Bradyrhizobium sp. JR1.5]|uniref:hypothetical protein n=1 Tax=unclassified Bradyrhizobium TaxID=2631580 RepID=UPI003397E452
MIKKESKEKLKEQNTSPLMTILVVNFAIFALALKTDQFLAAEYEELLKHWQALIPAGLGAVLISVINGVLDVQTKARLVFWRWHDPLPGCRAFSYYLHRDPRIDVTTLKTKVGPFSSNSDRAECSLVQALQVGRGGSARPTRSSPFSGRATMPASLSCF